MFKKIVTLIVSITFIWLQSSVSYAENIYYKAFDDYKYSLAYNKLSSKGLTAQLGFKVPFGNTNKSAQKSYYGFKLTYGQEFKDSHPFKYGKINDLNLLDGRFNKQGLNEFKLANVEVLNSDDRHYIFGNGNGNGNGTILMTLGLVALAAGVCWAAGCFDGDDTSSSSSE